MWFIQKLVASKILTSFLFNLQIFYIPFCLLAFVHTDHSIKTTFPASWITIEVMLQPRTILIVKGYAKNYNSYTIEMIMDP